MLVEKTMPATGQLISMELGAGAFFGEAALAAVKGAAFGRRSASVRALERCHLYVLQRDDFIQALIDFPEYKSVLTV